MHRGFQNNEKPPPLKRKYEIFGGSSPICRVSQVSIFQEILECKSKHPLHKKHPQHTNILIAKEL